MIVDFRPLNAHCEHLPVQYDDLREVRHLFARPVTALFSFDLKDGYFHVPIHPNFRRFFGFHV